MSSDQAKSVEPRSNLQLGTFLGVFTPTVLTILGVIMYLRVGWAVGQVGLAQTLLIVIISNVITFFTALSLSTVATNMNVGVGGGLFPYFSLLRTRSRGSNWNSSLFVPNTVGDSLCLRAPPNKRQTQLPPPRVPLWEWSAQGLSNPPRGLRRKEFQSPPEKISQTPPKMERHQAHR